MGAPRHGIVLVVEDEPIVRELVVIKLKELGFAPLEAAAGLASTSCTRHRTLTCSSPISACRTLTARKWPRKRGHCGPDSKFWS
jgi:hypothetical protein